MNFFVVSSTYLCISHIDICVYVHVHVCMYVCIRMHHTYIHICIYTLHSCIQVCTYIHADKHKYSMYVWMDACMFMCLYVCMCARMYAYACMCVSKKVCACVPQITIFSSHVRDRFVCTKSRECSNPPNWNNNVVDVQRYIWIYIHIYTYMRLYIICVGIHM